MEWVNTVCNPKIDERKEKQRRRRLNVVKTVKRSSQIFFLLQVYCKFRFFLSIFLHLRCLDFEMSGVDTNTRDVGYIPFSREYV